ncbi:hypothetical protein B0H14DRAFT_2590813 [Mycena olivaceomarginata]|nr:hypothetical protein B0H14DRAFT_2590813 [Mycena olivaceomarginata]
MTHRSKASTASQRACAPQAWIVAVVGIHGKGWCKSQECWQPSQASCGPATEGERQERALRGTLPVDEGPNERRPRLHKRCIVYIGRVEREALRGGGGELGMCAQLEYLTPGGG